MNKEIKEWVQSLPANEFKVLQEMIVNEQSRRVKTETVEKQKALNAIENMFDTYFRKFGCYPTIRFEADNYTRIEGIKVQLLTDPEDNEVYLLMKEDY